MISLQDTAITGCTFDTTNTSATVTVNKTTHGLVAGDLFTFTSVLHLVAQVMWQLILQQIHFKS